MDRSVLKVLTHPAVVGAVSFVTGVGVGYILTRRKVEVYEVPEVEFPRGWPKAPLTVESLNGDIEEGAQVQVVVTENIPSDTVIPTHVKLLEEDQSPEVEDRNVFANDDEWDYEFELASREGKDVYIIHKDEFWEDSQGFTQSTLTYFEGDRILVDEDEKPIYDIPNCLGPEENLRFGHGSGDPNVVHIRNTKWGGEYEVIRDSGFYQVEILGAQIEHVEEEKDLKHSRAPMKFRDD